MAELFGLNLTQHLDNFLQEVKSQQSIYGYPLKKLFKPNPDCDLSTLFHGKRAATPLGPASGPHTQMAQNIVLAFLGGSRIMELKTVQILDELDIPRPCIDMRNVGYNVEWSQELKLEDSYHEYVIAWMLLKILEDMEILGIPKGDPFYDVIFDLSVGYDLKGISSPEIASWISRMKNAESAISERLAELPNRYAAYRALEIDPKISSTLTLSTFHGCPRDEIRSIVEYLIDELDLDVIVKMNPTQLGYEFVSKTLNEDLGYEHICLDEHAFEADLQFDEAIEMMRHLEIFAKERGKKVGAKFTNTLVVKNNDEVFKDEVMYLSGVPLHVLSMNAMLNFRNAIGSHMPVSFSAGIDSENFVDAISCDMTPVTVCSDLLRKGGYTRQVNYLRKMENALKKSGTCDIESFVRKTAGLEDGAAHEAGLKNAARVVPALVGKPKYHYSKNSKPPKKVGSSLEFFDCLTCNICLPVCPNAANFNLPLGEQEKNYHHFEFKNGEWVPAEEAVFSLTKPGQIGNLADFCNECGNCDTFCPEDGGPYIMKPRFFSSESTYREFTSHDGFFFEAPEVMTGRIDGKEYMLAFDKKEKTYRFRSPVAELVLDTEDQVVSGTVGPERLEGERMDMAPYQKMRALLDGFMVSGDYPSTLLRSAQHAKD